MDSNDKLRMKRIEQILGEVLTRLGEIRDLLAAQSKPPVKSGRKTPPPQD